MYKLAVIGSDVTKSFSPQIQKELAKQAGIELQYDKLSTNKLTKETLERFHGANITFPFKEIAYQLCDKTTKQADYTNTVNTVKWHEGLLIGTNTDTDGFATDFSFTGESVLLVGAGGAAKAILPVLKERFANVYIQNRTSEKAAKLGQPYKDQHVDGVVLAQSCSLQHKLPDAQWLYDLNYGERSAQSAAYAKEHNMRYSSGEGMLVEQARRAFEFWFNIIIK